MVTKRIVVLANSIKKGDRCVAGREIGIDGQVGPWVRPISDVNEGALARKHRRLMPPRQLGVLDIVRVPLVRHAGDPYHPEDWYVGRLPWLFQCEASTGLAGTIEERPTGLWLEDPDHTHRVTGGYLLAQRQHQSLYMIRPRDLRIRWSQRFNQDKGYDEKKRRAVFTYAGIEYDLGLTDPEITDRYCTDFPAAGAPYRERTLPRGDGYLLCVSLTPLLNGYHYKVVATVLEVP